MKNGIKNEVWKQIFDYPNYEISTLGRVKSHHGGKDVIINQYISSGGYLRFTVYKDAKHKTVKTHQIMAITFLGHERSGMNLVIDHIDGNKLNNNLDNLRLVTTRENATNYRNQNSHKYTSKYIGVSKKIRIKKDGTKSVVIRSCIYVNGKTIHLGRFNTEQEAHKAYLEKKNSILSMRMRKECCNCI